MAIERVISGGQTGADQAGWRAAGAAGIPTGGSMPRGFLTEQGPRPEFAATFGAVELEAPDYPPRTRANVRDSDGTVIFGNPATRGSRTTIEACRELGKPYLIVVPDVTLVSEVREWLRSNMVRTLNVAGNRESTTPGIGARVEAFLGRLFKGGQGG